MRARPSGFRFSIFYFLFLCESDERVELGLGGARVNGLRGEAHAVQKIRGAAGGDERG